MTHSKKIIPALAFILLAGGAFGATQAKAYDCPAGHNMHRPCMEQNSTITDAQRKEARMLVEKAQSTMLPLKQQMFIKHEELKALQNAATPDVTAVSKKATEITELQQKIAAERKALGMAIDKALGLEPGTHNFDGKGYGKGHGKGSGMGHGKGSGMGHGKDHGNQHQM